MKTYLDNCKEIMLYLKRQYLKKENKVLDGKKIKDLMRQYDKQKILKLRLQGMTPTVYTFYNINDIPSKNYVGMKKKYFESMGINSIEISYDDYTADKLIKKFEELEKDKNAVGILLQFPLNKELEKYSEDLCRALPISLDIDGLNLGNLDSLKNGDENAIWGATPKGMIALLETYRESINNKTVTIIGNSPLIGRQLRYILTNFYGYENCYLLDNNFAYEMLVEKAKDKNNIFVCNSKTPDILKNYALSHSDIVFSGVGKNTVTPTGEINFVAQGQYLQDNSVVVDAGITSINGKLYPDVNIEGEKNRLKAFSLVTGSTGPATIAMLGTNAVRCAEQKYEVNKELYLPSKKKDEVTMTLND